MVVGPDWKGATPAGIKKVFRSSTQFSLAALSHPAFQCRTTSTNVKKVQAGYKAQPLSAYLKQPAPPAAPAIDFPEDRQGTREDELLRVSRLRSAVRSAPAENEKDIRAKLARIGVGPGKTFNFKDLPLEHKAEVVPRHEGRRTKNRRRPSQGRQVVNGWQVSSLFGDRAFFNGDWLKRAAAAKARHLWQRRGGGDVSANARRQRWQTLDGSKHNYTLTFPPDQLPPVNAFWSVTMYDGKTPAADRESDQPLSDQFADAAEHEEERRRLADALHPEQSPGKDKESNWLPAPMVRSTWSCGSTGRREAPSILPPGEGTWQPPGVHVIE